MSITLKIHFVGQHLFVKEPDGDAWTVVMPKLAGHVHGDHAGGHTPHATQMTVGAPPPVPIDSWPPLSKLDGGVFEFRATGPQAAFPEGLANFSAATGRNVLPEFWKAPGVGANRRVSIRLHGGAFAAATRRSEYTVGGQQAFLASDIEWTGAGVPSDALVRARTGESAIDFPQVEAVHGVVELSVLSLPQAHFDDPRNIDHKPNSGTHVPHCEAMSACFGLPMGAVPVVFIADSNLEMISIDPWLCVASGGFGG